MQGEPRTMQLDPRYDDVAAEVAAFLEERMAFAVANGVGRRRICLDPASGSGRPSRTTSSCFAGSMCCSRSAGRC
jgi:dihydropteroate synthase